MRINTKINTYNTPYSQISTPNFEKRVRAKHVQQLTNPKTLNKNYGIKKIKNIRAGKYSTICDGSIPMRRFFQNLKQLTPYVIMKKGISTNTYGYAPSFLKSSADNPLSTSFVHDCSVMYLYNKKTNTHTLYHSLWDVPKKNFKFIIRNFMPEGVTHAAIAPGNDIWVEKHRFTLPDMFNAIKESDPNTIINVYHSKTLYPEIVGYKGQLYEIPNREIKEQLQFTRRPTDYGQASFKISDIRESQTLYKIRNHRFSAKDLKSIKEDFNNQNYDKEIKKVISAIIDNELEILLFLGKCKTQAGLFNLKISKGINAIKNFCQSIHDNIAKHFI